MGTVPSAVARRYGKALFELAQEAGQIDRWQRQLEQLRTILEHPSVRGLVDNPAIPTQRRIEVIDALDTGVLGNEVRNLGRLLVETRRADLAGEVVEEYRELADEAAGRVRATATTAIELSERDQRRVGQDLSRRLGREVRLECRVDPAILGGLVLQLGDRLIDASLRSRLHQLRRRLAGA